ncbi:MAG: hypothetical protein SFY81_15235 [Verrucomicrobiota bacterium]|nr:hypothetical protein [Verrucomicrobiota bacterium]
MHLRQIHSSETGLQRSVRASAFTVTELMVAVALMGVIVVSLYAVFNVTQGALRKTETQGDVSEKGRAVMELITREVEQTVASGIQSNRNLAFGLGLILNPTLADVRGITIPIIQSNVQNTLQIRTNTHHYLYLLHKQTNVWTGIGYRIGTARVGDAVGTLERIENSWTNKMPHPDYLFSNFVQQASITNNTNFHLVSEGLVHFRVVPFSKNGFRLGWDTAETNGLQILRQESDGLEIERTSTFYVPDGSGMILRQVPFGNEESVAMFFGNSLPHYLDIEIGVLEPATLKQYNQMIEDGLSGQATTFLSRNLSKVHLYRQRVPIRTAVQ